MSTSSIIRYESAGRLDLSNGSKVPGQKFYYGIESYIREVEAKMELFMED